MKSRRSFLQFLALAPVAVAASSKIIALSTPPAATTVGRGMMPSIIQCDEFGNPDPIRYQLSLEIQARIDAMRIRHSNANVDALFRHNDYLQKLSAKHHVSAG